MTENEQMTQDTVEVQGGAKSSNSTAIVGIVAILAILAGVVFFMKQKPAETMENVTPSANTEGQRMTSAAPTASSVPVTGESTSITKEGDVTVVTMDAGSFYYSQKEIKVKEGDKVKIVMTSKDMMHDFNIDELNVKMPITKSGETSTVEFTASKKGTFEYYCSVGQHRSHGQVGKLIVE